MSKITLPLSQMTLIRYWNTQGQIILNPLLLDDIGMSLNSLATVPLYNWNKQARMLFIEQLVGWGWVGLTYIVNQRKF